MDKLKISLIMVFGIVIIGGIIYFTLPEPKTDQNENQMMDNGQMINHDGMMTGKTKEFNLRSFNWDFDPKEIVVNLGDKVILHVTSDDIDHGLAINEFLVNKRIQPGMTTDIEFIADKRGIFETYCSVPCGEGHLNMKGKLIVK